MSLEIYEDNSFESFKALKKPSRPELENLLVYTRSNDGFPLYNSYYKALENHLRNNIEDFNEYLRLYFRLEQCKSSVLLDLKDPIFEHYRQRFPQKQFEVKSDNFHYGLKPACCANALKIWAHQGSKIKKGIIHELSDCYRRENRGTLRTFKRGSYFTMPDYHMNTIDSDFLKDFQVIRTGLFEFYKKLWGPQWKNLFHEVFRVEKSKFPIYKDFIENLVDQGIVELFESSEPYYELKYEISYKGSSQLFTLGTIQIDYVYPQLFKLDQKEGVRPVLHFSPGSIQRIIEVMVTQDNIPKRGMKLYCVNKKPQDFLEKVTIDCGILIDNTSKNLKECLSRKNPYEKIFYPVTIIFGEKEEKNQSVTLAYNGINETISWNQLVERVNKDNTYIHKKETHYTKLCN